VAQVSSQQPISPAGKPVATNPTTPAMPTQQPPINPGHPIFKKLLVALVLIIVLGLAIIFAFNFSKQQQTGKRDAQRKQDLASIQKALALYKEKTLNASYYPSAITPTTLEKEGYIAKIPKDPINKSGHVYNYLGTPSGCVINCTGYLLTACLENKNDKQGITPTSPCTTRTYQVAGQ